LATEGLLEKILDRDNMNQAYKKVKFNKGAGGIDEMEVDELHQYLRENGQQLIQAIKDGKYRPNPVRMVEINKNISKNISKPNIKCY
jgi:RNA-directed DNA polymerase